MQTVQEFTTFITAYFQLRKYLRRYLKTGNTNDLEHANNILKSLDRIALQHLLEAAISELDNPTQ